MKNYAQTILLLIFSISVLVAKANAQDIGALYTKASAAVQEEKWGDAIAVYNEIISTFGNDSQKVHGPKFGGIHFDLALCYKNSGNLEEALKNYKICYTTYANKPDTADTKKNPVELAAMIETASILSFQKNHEEALPLYENAFSRINEFGRTIPKGPFFLNYSKALASGGKIDKSKEILIKTFDNAKKLRISNANLMDGFLGMIDSQITSLEIAEKPNPKALESDLIQFMDKYQENLDVAPLDKDTKQNLNTRLIKNAQESSRNSMPNLAIKLFSLVSSKSTVADEINEKLANYERPPKKLKTLYDTVAQDTLNPESNDVLAQMALATTHQKLGNFRAAFTIYDHLTSSFPNSTKLNHLLFGAVQTASMIGDPDATIYFGDRLLNEFPDYPNLDAATTIVLQRLYFSGRYEEALEVAGRMGSKFPEGSSIRDTSDFVTAGSIFNLQRYEESLPLLEKHVESYPESPYAEASLGMLGSNYVVFGNWPKAAPVLDKFIKKYPDSSGMDVALYQRAQCYYGQQQYTESAETIQKMRVKHPDSTMLDQALNLKGDIHYLKEDVESAIESYNSARESAKLLIQDETDAHSNADQHAISQLLVIANEAKDYEKGAKLYDEFFPKYENSQYYASTIATAGVSPLSETGRTSQALEQIEKIISRMSNEESPKGIESLAGTWLGSSLDVAKIPADQIKEKLVNWPLYGYKKTPLLEATLLLTQWDLLDDKASIDKIKNLEGEKNYVTKQLQSFDKGLLSSPTVYRLGNQLYKNGSSDQAVEWYQEVIKRADSEYVPASRVKLAKVDVDSGDSAKIDQAVTLFDQIIGEYPDTKHATEAIVSKARVMYDIKRSYTKSLPVLKEIKDNYKNMKQADRAEMLFKCGRAAEETGEKDLAGLCYLQFFTSFAGYIEYAPEARVRGLLYSYNTVSELPDKDTALEKKSAYYQMQKVVYGYRKLRGDERDKGDWIGKAMYYYKQWQQELAIEPDPSIEEGIEFPTSLPK